jgi:HlyD family secretion protein
MRLTLIPRGQLGKTILKRRKALAIIVLAAIAVIGAAEVWSHKANAIGFITARAERHDVDVTISATGNVQAVTTVEVGSQVSGTVSWLGADFKSQVKRGQVIAKLDPTIFQAQVENQQANLSSAEASLQAAITDVANQEANLISAKANQDALRIASLDAQSLLKRDSDLKNVMADRDIEAAKASADSADGRYQQSAAQTGQAEAAVEDAKAQRDEASAKVVQARAQLAQAEVDLKHSIITSPIDGIVISRNVDVGQTVAASLQAPVLFVIANDLSHMRVLASIDEADVGQIHEGMPASFRIDAYPNEMFEGRISQIRLDSQNQQNVVTYFTVIETTNPDQKLLPGMTANITVLVAQARDVLTVPNAALRFKPDQQAPKLDVQNGTTNSIQQPASTGKAGGQSHPGLTATANPTAGQLPKEATVWVLKEKNQIEPRSVSVGITNGRVTEISGGTLNEGEAVVVGQG